MCMYAVVKKGCYFVVTVVWTKKTDVKDVAG